MSNNSRELKRKMLLDQLRLIDDAINEKRKIKQEVIDLTEDDVDCQIIDPQPSTINNTTATTTSTSNIGCQTSSVYNNPTPSTSGTVQTSSVYDNPMPSTSGLVHLSNIYDNPMPSTSSSFMGQQTTNIYENPTPPTQPIQTSIVNHYHYNYAGPEKKEKEVNILTSSAGRQPSTSTSNNQGTQTAITKTLLADYMTNAIPFYENYNEFVKKVEDIYRCAICGKCKLLATPLILSCCHSFCKICILKWTTVGVKNRNGFSECPLCRIEIKDGFPKEMY